MCKRYSYLCYYRGHGACNENDKEAITFPGSERAIKRFVAHVQHCEHYNPVLKTCGGKGVQEIPLRPTLSGDRLICGDCAYEQWAKTFAGPKTVAEEAYRSDMRATIIAETKRALKERGCRQAESECQETNPPRNEECGQEALHGNSDGSRGRQGESVIPKDRSATSSARQSTSGTLDIPRRDQPSNSGSYSKSSIREESSNRNRNDRPSSRRPINTIPTQRGYYRSRDDEDIRGFREAIKLVGTDESQSADSKGKDSALPLAKNNKKGHQQNQ